MGTWVFVVLVTAATPGAAAPATGAGGPAPAASSAPKQAVRPAARSGKQLRDDVHQTLRAAAVQSGAERDAAIRRLTAIYVELSRDTQLPMDERLTLGRTIRNRLVKVKDQLTRAARASSTATGFKSAQAASSQPAAATASTAGASASQATTSAAASSGGHFGGAADDAGAELVDLIERTIAPDTWDTVGGEGTIRYYSTWHALVVRQTDEAHDLVRGVVEGLRN